MNTLFHAELSEREFSSHLLHVGDLLAWAESKRLHLRTSPALDGFEFVQVEALLCAIERHAGDVTTDQAMNIVLNDPVLKNDPVVTRYPDDIDPTTCRWLLGAEAHRKWRELLSGAIAAHELALLDFGSKLPIDAPPEQSTATPAPVVAASNTPAIPKSKRPDLLTPLIEAAQRGETDPFNAAVIWHKLCNMVDQKIKPLLGKTEDGIQWLDGNDDGQSLSLENLRDRLTRQRKAAQNRDKPR